MEADDSCTEEGVDPHNLPPNIEAYMTWCFNTRTQRENQSLEHFVEDLRQIAKGCNFGSLEERLIRDRVIAGIKRGDLRIKLFEEADLTLDRCIQICQEWETRKRTMTTAVDEGMKYLKENRRKGPLTQRSGQTHSHDGEKYGIPSQASLPPNLDDDSTSNTDDYDQEPTSYSQTDNNFAVLRKRLRPNLIPQPNFAVKVEPNDDFEDADNLNVSFELGKQVVRNSAASPGYGDVRGVEYQKGVSLSNTFKNDYGEDRNSGYQREMSLSNTSKNGYGEGRNAGYQRENSLSNTSKDDFGDARNSGYQRENSLSNTSKVDFGDARNSGYQRENILSNTAKDLYGETKTFDDAEYQAGLCLPNSSEDVGSEGETSWRTESVFGRGITNTERYVKIPEETNKELSRKGASKRKASSTSRRGIHASKKGATDSVSKKKGLKNSGLSVESLQLSRVYEECSSSVMKKESPSDISKQNSDTARGKSEMRQKTDERCKKGSKYKTGSQKTDAKQKSETRQTNAQSRKSKARQIEARQTEARQMWDSRQTLDTREKSERSQKSSESREKNSEMRPKSSEMRQKCSETRPNLAAEARQKTSKSKPKSHVCSECGAAHATASLLARHMRKHTGLKPFECFDCGSRFTRSCHLKAHALRHKGIEPKKYSCKECSASFVNSSNLIVHMRKHSGEKPYMCSDCGATFRRSDNLKSHLRVHSGERPFSCKECSARFAHVSDLKRHAMRKHSLVKPWMCHECGVSFGYAAGLTTHMLKHTGGDKPYPCQLCGASFTNSSNFNRHMVRKHNRKPNTRRHAGTVAETESELSSNVNFVSMTSNPSDGPVPETESERGSNVNCVSMTSNPSDFRRQAGSVAETESEQSSNVNFVSMTSNPSRHALSVAETESELTLSDSVNFSDPVLNMPSNPGDLHRHSGSVAETESELSDNMNFTSSVLRVSPESASDVLDMPSDVRSGVFATFNNPGGDARFMAESETERELNSADFSGSVLNMSSNSGGLTKSANSDSLNFHSSVLNVSSHTTNTNSGGLTKSANNNSGSSVGAIPNDSSLDFTCSVLNMSSNTTNGSLTKSANNNSSIGVLPNNSSLDFPTSVQNMPSNSSAVTKSAINNSSVGALPNNSSLDFHSSVLNISSNRSDLVDGVLGTTPSGSELDCVLITAAGSRSSDLVASVSNTHNSTANANSAFTAHCFLHEDNIDHPAFDDESGNMSLLGSAGSSL